MTTQGVTDCCHSRFGLSVWACTRACFCIHVCIFFFFFFFGPEGVRVIKRRQESWLHLVTYSHFFRLLRTKPLPSSPPFFSSPPPSLLCPVVSLHHLPPTATRATNCHVPQRSTLYELLFISCLPACCRGSGGGLARM